MGDSENIFSDRVIVDFEIGPNRRMKRDDPIDVQVASMDLESNFGTRKGRSFYAPGHDHRY